MKQDYFRTKTPDEIRAEYRKEQVRETYHKQLADDPEVMKVQVVPTPMSDGQKALWVIFLIFDLVIFLMILTM